MSKLKCTCGNIIVDQTDNLPYKGYILPDTQVEKVSNTLSDSIDKLTAAIKSNTRIDWIKENFGPQPYPTDLEDSSLIHDLLTRVIIETTQNIFECENCGRVAIEIGQTNHYKFYSLDSNDTKGILKGKK